MKFQKIINLTDTTSDDKNCRGNVNKEIRIKTSMLRSDLFDFSDTYIVVKGTITVTNPNDAKKKYKAVAFKDNAPLINCI